jgi:hypothetical protein
MLSGKLCEVLGTDIDGIHDALMNIPGFSYSGNTYSVTRAGYIFTLIMYPTCSNYIAISAATIEGCSPTTFAVLLSDEAETLFLELIAKPIVSVKSARN